ncbi:MAG: hypothetical protein H7066_17070 [Cytophagaceae bacterium]|nr:hypothetical protein [Gemmatimonadaceae bacterium]
MKHMRRHVAFSVSLVAVLVLGACGGGAKADGAGSTSSGVALDASRVPEDLRALVPIVQEWGIGDDVDRGDKVEGASAEERQKLRDALAPHQDRITAWLNSFGQNVMPDEAAAFMYAQLALEEINAAERR